MFCCHITNTPTDAKPPAISVIHACAGTPPSIPETGPQPRLGCRVVLFVDRRLPRQTSRSGLPRKESLPQPPLRVASKLFQVPPASPEPPTTPALLLTDSRLYLSESSGFTRLTWGFGWFGAFSRFAQAAPKHLTWLRDLFGTRRGKCRGFELTQTRLCGVALSMRGPTASEWDQLWLPLWPLASDDLRAGIYRMARGDALARRYIEANPDAVSNLLVIDIDHPDAFLRAVSHRSGWLPNAVVENRSTGRSHAVWALLEAIKPLYGALTRGMGLMTSHWLTELIELDQKLSRAPSTPAASRWPTLGPPSPKGCDAQSTATTVTRA